MFRFLVPGPLAMDQSRSPRCSRVAVQLPIVERPSRSEARLADRNLVTYEEVSDSRQDRCSEALASEEGLQQGDDCRKVDT